ncbi:phage virion morphogenesis protein [Lysobacter capsici]|uniref:phage virion morphogenesis protein n=1 Tax=Lysobacter capsici TaxID=435897 RepID=UPI00177DF0F9|nr:phage virion morphogenesis protein [Lysobacter capsici]UOF16462.1 phage virion morphogenesis protein [Lysobacter capsici]
MDELQQLEAWVAPLLAKLEPSQRRALARTIGGELRRGQIQRIRDQRNPDGSAYAPRKRDEAGKIKRRKAAMFQRITQARYLKIEASERGAAVGFLGRVARIARVHQEGLTDRVDRDGPSVRYERRQLLGFTEAERQAIRDLLVEHLTR